MDILVRNESSDQEESLKHVFEGRVSSVSSPFSKIDKQLPDSDRKSSCLYQKYRKFEWKFEL